MKAMAFDRLMLARYINSARYATSVAPRPGYDREGCKNTAHGFIVKAIEKREALKAMGFKLP